MFELAQSIIHTPSLAAIHQHNRVILLQYFLDRVAIEAAQDKSSFPSIGHSVRTLFLKAQLLLPQKYPDWKVLIAYSTLRSRTKPQSTPLSPSITKLNSHFSLTPFFSFFVFFNFYFFFILFFLLTTFLNPGILLNWTIYCSPNMPISILPPLVLCGLFPLPGIYILPQLLLKSSQKSTPRII